MKPQFLALLVVVTSLAGAQGHDTKTPEAMKSIQFLVGDWSGKQTFNTGGPAMVGDITVKVHETVGGRYLEEVLSTTLPGRKPTDTRHFLTFDPTTNSYHAWWFNDTSYGPTELEGKLSGDVLVLESHPKEGSASPVLRATYDKQSDTKLAYKLEMKTANGWQELFHNTYAKMP